jgi:4'-phosphopantetheinyl transferase
MNDSLLKDDLEMKNTVKTNNDDLHLWLVKMSEESSFMAEYFSYLSLDEKKKADSFFFDEDKMRYIISHGALRCILGVCFGVEPDKVEFSRTKNGKPFMVFPDSFGYCFNMSHSLDYAAFALIKSRDVGIDIEYKKDIKDLDAIVRRFFSEKEIENYFMANDADSINTFFKYWTRKEAFVKAIGEGLNFPLSGFSVHGFADEIPHVEIFSGEYSKHEWFLRDLNIEDDRYAAAVAVKGRIDKIISHRWNVRMENG